jgi:hypothetical protein
MPKGSAMSSSVPNAGRCYSPGERSTGGVQTIVRPVAGLAADAEMIMAAKGPLADDALAGGETAVEAIMNEIMRSGLIPLLIYIAFIVAVLYLFYLVLYGVI